MTKEEEQLQEVINELTSLKITIREKEAELEDKIEELQVLKKHEKEYRRRLEQGAIRVTGTYDRDGTPIWYGDTVTFLTKGSYDSTEGRVYKVSQDKSRVTCKDKRDFSITRAPHNVKVKKRGDSRDVY